MICKTILNVSRKFNFFLALKWKKQFLSLFVLCTSSDLKLNVYIKVTLLYLRFLNSYFCFLERLENVFNLVDKIHAARNKSLEGKGEKEGNKLRKKEKKVERKERERGREREKKIKKKRERPIFGSRKMLAYCYVSWLLNSRRAKLRKRESHFRLEKYRKEVGNGNRNGRRWKNEKFQNFCKVENTNKKLKKESGITRWTETRS